MINYPIKCAVCRITVVGSMEIETEEDYPGDESCSLVCDSCMLIEQENQIDFPKRQSNINQMNSYMGSLVSEGSLTQANFDLFLADTATNTQGYLSGGGRLITWIETVNRNGYNATAVGFKTKTAYRGSLVNGLYPRAEMILSILNNL